MSRATQSVGARLSGRRFVAIGQSVAGTWLIHVNPASALRTIIKLDRRERHDGLLLLVAAADEGP
jgi:hypothetical protein